MQTPVPPPPFTPSAPLPEVYNLTHYVLQRKFWVVFGALVTITDAQERPLLFCKQKAFKLKEDIRLYADAQLTREQLLIQARNIIDFSAAYDVRDSTTGAQLGTLRRKGWSSMLRDSWEIMDATGQPVGKIQEDSAGMALLRRLVGMIIELAAMMIPQTFNYTLNNGAQVAQARQRFNPFVQKIDLTLTTGTHGVLDPRLILAAATLVLLIEGRQR
jgi:hypothetical protein